MKKQTVPSTQAPTLGLLPVLLSGSSSSLTIVEIGVGGAAYGKRLAMFWSHIVPDLLGKRPYAGHDPSLICAVQGVPEEPWRASGRVREHQ